MLTWMHDDDSVTPCRPVTMQTGEWRCIAHGELVKMSNPEPIPVKTYETGTNINELMATIYAPQVAELRREAEEADAARSVVAGDAVLKQVGWYCAGEHQRESSRGFGMVNVKGPSLRMDDEKQCEHAVAAYVLVKPSIFHLPVVVDRSTSPDWDWVRTLIGHKVVVRFRKDSAPLMGELLGLDDEDVMLRRDVHGTWLTARSGVAAIETVDSGL